jgi:phosphoribosylanthranilate isomerase
MRRFVKICGVRTLDDALACAKAGADAIGFNFWPQSKRYLPVEEAGRIAKKLPSSLRTVGVFVNATEPEVMRAFSAGAVDWVQLHGDETPEFCLRFAGRYMKAVRLVDDSSLAEMDRYTCDLLLVDADAPNYGGSGQRADVGLARRAAAKRRIVLAGGLTPENVAAAVREIDPYGVDVAGGVESAPGVKDWKKVAAFVEAARGGRS